ncbi:MAG: HupE/UreJ family protein [Limnobacter sp.]|nr:HupE/UreJ family protein [Limnobacter sp.]
MSPFARFPYLIALLLLTLCSLKPLKGHAHEMGTSALTIQEFSSLEGASQGKIVFKRSRAADGNLAPIEFKFQPECKITQSQVEWEDDNEVFQYADFECSQPLSMHKLEVAGFMRLAPDLILKSTALDGSTVQAVLNPQRPVADLSGTKPTTSMWEYLSIGIEHIVLGWDHVLFITGLFLLWQQRRQTPGQLLGQFTLFTVGHSLTLGLLVLGWIAVPTRLIEAWIALSVLYLAVQWVLKTEESPKTQYALILAFGLLHGSGFALSMESRGFPEDSLFSTLLLFNLGIELGQLLIVLVLFSVFAGVKKISWPLLQPFLQNSMVICMGGASLYWTVERVSTYAPF